MRRCGAVGEAWEMRSITWKPRPLNSISVKSLPRAPRSSGELAATSVSISYSCARWSAATIATI